MFLQSYYKITKNQHLILIINISIFVSNILKFKIMIYDSGSFQKVIINKVDGSILSFNNVKVITSGNYLLIREETSNNLSHNTVVNLGDIITFTTK